uniref:Small acidic protein n=1 Tax=Trypanosoma congolense (strain IL3000) TaxID=1068625 RepID=G0V1Q3_TRYCI|nr:unnamed protein product [Trypanosoma congolense IL3000]
MSSLKSVAKELRETVTNLAISRGLDPDEEFTRHDACVLLAVAALKQLEKSSVAEDLTDTARSARRALRAFVPSAADPQRHDQEEGQQKSSRRDHKRGREDEANNGGCVGGNKDDDANICLGQYAKAHVFDDDVKKRTKFARLMGGVRGEKTSHSTFAPDVGTIKRINGELEEQFNSALVRAGKKGLGA